MVRFAVFSPLGFAVIALALPHSPPFLNATTVTIHVNETTTICPTPNPTLAVTSLLEVVHSTGSSPGVSPGPSPVQGGQASSTAEASSTAGASNGQLSLKRDWDIDASDFSQLDPKKSCRMLYAKEQVPLGEKPAENEPYAWVNMNETEYPTIQTVNSKYYKKVWCDQSAGWIKMAFNSPEAYNHAWNSWHDDSRAKWGDYVVITPESSCKNYGDTSQRNFIRAISEVRDDSSMTITCQTKDISFGTTVGDENPTEVEFENFNQPDVSAQANEATQNGQFNDLGGEVLVEPSGDSDFDEYRDAVIGRMDLATLNNNTLNQFNLTLEDFYGENDLPDLVAQNLAKRRIGDRIKKAFKKVARAVSKAVTKVVNVVKKVASVIVETAKKVGDAIAKFTTIDKSLNKDIDFDTARLGQIVKTPFKGRDGYELFHAEFSNKSLPAGVEAAGTLDVFCVECGVRADLKLRGKVIFIVSRLKFDEGFIEVTGNMGAGVGLGIVADLTLTKEFKKQITSIPLTPFSIPNIFVIGPKFDLSAGVEFELEAQGQLLAGVQLDWPAVSARMDIVNSASSFASGFKPVVTPVIEVEGSITLKTTFFLEGALGVGIDVLNGLFDKSVELIERPGIFVSAGVGASFDLETGVGGFGDNDCRGVNIAIGLSNEVSVNVFDIDALSTTIDEQSIELGSKCIPFFRKRDEYDVNGSGYPLIDGRQMQTRAIGDTTFEGGILTMMTTRDEDRTFRLRYSPNGNTYAVEEDKVPEEEKASEWSGWFASDPSGAFIFGDSHSRVYHGYTDTLIDFGVSRLRLHKPDQMPKTAQPMVFASIIPEEDISAVNASAPVAANSTISPEMPYMIISDMGGNIYFPIICVYDGTVYPKMFMANDTVSGVETLMSNSPEILRTVTGANMKECGYVPLTNGILGKTVGTLSSEAE
ncbi:hypothetical protein BJ875DRAFT_488610 [Amylocarpus encephaloides]|uniref:Peptidase A1 domain-containing protein n=1 Tax=Amylocarpus encephaloides TaxID=45428 RepID=A0A9P7Y9R5_9HELO|nr:hypothetical protein BJ875DRAFT_488610 [Amylocarpus encephaloides]